jgi:hypothetical protein
MFALLGYLDEEVVSLKCDPETLGGRTSGLVGGRR